VEPNFRRGTVDVCSLLGGVTGYLSGPAPNEVDSITAAHAGVVARIHDHGSVPSLGRGCDVSQQLRHGVACPESLKGSKQP